MGFSRLRGKRHARRGNRSGTQMMTSNRSIIPPDEANRIEAVRRYDILDTPADGSFDRVTAMAARRFRTPISLITIVDHDRIWFKSRYGINFEQIGRDPGLCASAILKPDPHILPDATKDIGALANPLVAGDFGLRFYAGVPLRTSDGYNLGTLCVIDKEPRPFGEDEIEDLKDLSSLVTDQLEFRLSAIRSLAEAERAIARTKILAREIDHRVMNSLQFVSSLLRLQAKSADGDAAGQLDMAAGRVAAVARVHRHFHLEDDAESVRVPDYLQRLCEDLSGILDEKVDVIAENGFLPTVALQPVGLIINELVTNAAKHGSGKITVTYNMNDGHEFAVCDEGIGFPPDFDPTASPRGLGMRVVQILTHQLGGNISVGTIERGKGACFTVTFPTH